MCQDQQQVLEGLRANNSKAVECLYREVFPKFFAYVFRSDKTQMSDAEDIFQDTLIEVIAHVKKGNAVQNIFSLLFISALNKWKKWNKKKGRQGDSNTDPTDRNSPLFKITEEYLKEFGLNEKHFAEILLESEKTVDEILMFLCIKSSNGKCYPVLKLTYCDNKSDEEIATILGFENIGSVRVKRHRCLNRLKNFFNRNKEK